MIKPTTNIPVIAIDGPSASGKGTVAQQVAQHLGFHYLDSGALYRVVALAAKQHAIAWHDENALADLAGRLDIAFVEGKILLNGMDVSTQVRSEEIGRGASEVAVHPAVRLALLGLQHAFRQAPGLVADGRDIATVIFPDAVTKIYLTARVEIRAERRYKQLMSKGIHANLADILKDLEQRDARDSQRSAAPLRRADTAKLLETSELSIAQSIALALDYCKPVLESS